MGAVPSLDTAEYSDTTFVGRGEELRLFGEAFERMLAGRQQLITLSGEPGIGKTRCAEAFAHVAEDRGAFVLWGRCCEEPGAPAYWPWARILRAYIAASSDAEVHLTMGNGLRQIAAIMPDIAERLDETPRAAARCPDASQARFRAFDAIARFFANAAQQVPLVLIIDDLHWADKPSLALLEFLSQELTHSRVLILGTYRDSEVSRKSPLLSTLGGLSRGSGAGRVRLSGLPEAAIAELANRALGEALPHRAIRAINHQTDGNPLFVIELLKVLVEESAGIGVQPIAVRIPDGVRETIGRRLGHLPDTCNELLAIASVIGRDFRANEVATVAEQSLEIVLDGLEPAADAKLIEISDAAAGDYRFTHALIRETLYEEIPTLDRLRWHGRVGDALAQGCGGEPDTALARIAHHYYEATPLGNAHKAAEFAARAAAHAARIYAYEQAITHYDQVIGALEFGGGGNDERVARAYYLKGRALYALGQVRDCVEVLFRAAKLAHALGDAELVIDVTKQLVFSTSDAPHALQIPLLEQAIELLPEGDSAARARALAALAYLARGADDSSRIQTLIDEALAVARRIGDPAALCSCLDLATPALRGDPGALPQRLALSEEHIDAARAAGDSESLARAYAWRALDLIEAGRVDELEELLDRHESLNVARFGLDQYYVGAQRIMLALLRGEWEGLDNRIEALLKIGLKTRPDDAEGAYGAQMFVLNRDLGRLHALEPIVRTLVADATHRAWTPGLMFMCAELGLLNDARREFERLALDDFASIPKDDMHATCLVFCAETCCRLDDHARAARLYALVSPYADQTANHPRVACFGSFELYLAMLAGTAGDPSAAARHFELALERNRALRAWPWVARTQFHYGSLLLASDTGDEQSAGRALLKDAERLASRLGMETLLADVGALLSAPPSDAVFPDGLTGREIDVLRLIAMGRSNKDISTVLSISLNTVATHVRSILNKTHSANRTEAAAYAIRHELHA